MRLPGVDEPAASRAAPSSSSSRLPARLLTVRPADDGRCGALADGAAPRDEDEDETALRDHVQAVVLAYEHRVVGDGRRAAGRPVPSPGDGPCCVLSQPRGGPREPPEGPVRPGRRTRPTHRDATSGPTTCLAFRVQGPYGDVLADGRSVSAVSAVVAGADAIARRRLGVNLGRRAPIPPPALAIGLARPVGRPLPPAPSRTRTAAGRR